MLYRELGDLKLSRLGLGTGRLASLGAGHSKRDAARLLDTAGDAGINFIDTADTYGSGAAERWLGELLRGSRGGRFVLCTKAGYTLADLPWPLRAANQFAKKALHAMGRRQDFTPTRIRKCAEASLRRLRRESLDLFMLHDPPVAAVRDPALSETLAALRREGKVRRLGLSSADPAVLTAAAALPGIDTVQTLVNPLLGPTLATIPQPPLPVIANHIFAAGRLLCGEGDLLAERLTRVSRESGFPHSALLVCYAASQPRVVAALNGTANPAHLREAAEAIDLLDSETMHAALATAFPPKMP